MKTEFLVSDATLYGKDIQKEGFFSEYVRNCLYRGGYRTVGHLARMTAQELRTIKGIEDRQCAEIVRELATHGITIPENRTGNTHRIRDAARELPYPQNLIYAIFGIGANDESAAKELLDRDNIVGLNVALSKLSDQEETMIILRYKHLLTLEEVGKHYHLTGERARQIIEKAIRKLRHPVYSKYIRKGLNGYIEEIIARQVAERVKNLRDSEYTRGYNDGIKAFITGTDTVYEKKILLEDLNLSVRSYNCLKRAGITTVEEILELDGEKIMRIRNLGLKSTREIARKLQENGLAAPAWEELSGSMRDR